MNEAEDIRTAGKRLKAKPRPFPGERLLSGWLSNRAMNRIMDTCRLYKEERERNDG